MSKTNFVSWKEQFQAGLKGDTEKVITEKAWRGAKSQLTSEIATLEGRTIKLEDKLELAQENLEKARVNNHQIINEDVKYIDNLLEARNQLVIAEHALKVHEEKIAFLKNQLERLVSTNNNQ